MDYQQMRTCFTQYFQEKGHTLVPSASLIPAGDKSIMFTNAGMNQFKEVFTGHQKRDYTKAVSVQRCLRAGGKHNDLENVGYTSRHHTFFEMLGNFSFGDYFKEEAIEYALSFLIDELELSFDKMLVTVHHSDDEAFELWRKKGFDERRIIRCSDKDNFWSMGDIGPCGPCSEIFYDIGEHVPGGPPGSPDQEGDRFKEIWNLVFMQYVLSADGKRGPLPQPCVDTGMGLERLSSVIEGVDSNFKTSFFQGLKKDLCAIMGVKNHDAQSDIALNVIADHLRASSMMIYDSILPNNEGRGYVLRRLIRRALRYAYKLGVKNSFLEQGVDPFIRAMGSDFSGVSSSSSLIKEVLKKEQDQFFSTLGHGMKYLDTIRDSGASKLSGEVLFKLYDTYGFPLDIATDVAKEYDLQLDIDGYHQCMQEQKKRSKSASADKFLVKIDSSQLPSTPTFFDRQAFSLEQASLSAVLPGDEEQTSYLVFDKTPFYAESGGQIGDQGSLEIAGSTYVVEDTVLFSGQHLHKVREGVSNFTVGDQALLQVNASRRLEIARHHSATHLLHAALRSVLGDSVGQKGSLVTDKKLRFDFSYTQSLSRQEIARIESYVQERILLNTKVTKEQLSYEDALEKGAMAFFDDKYGDKVTMVTMAGGDSLELCGGTHVSRTGDIGFFQITGQEAVASGVRRLHAVVGTAALERYQGQKEILESACELMQAPYDQLPEQIQTLESDYHKLKKCYQHSLVQIAQQRIQSAAPDALTADLNLKVCLFDSEYLPVLKKAADCAKPLIKTLSLLLCFDEKKTAVLAVLSNDLKQKFSLKELLSFLSQEFSLKGGGKPGLFQFGGFLSKDEYVRLQQTLKSQLQKAIKD